MRRASDLVPLRLRRWVVSNIPDEQWRRLRPLVLGNTAFQQWLKRVSVSPANIRARALGGSVRAVHYGGTVRFGHLIERFDSEQVRLWNLRDVGAALDSGQVQWAVLEGEIARRSSVVVPRSSRTAALMALKQALSSQAVYARPRINGQWQRTRLLDRLGRRTDRLQAVWLYKIFTTQDGSVLASEDLGCSIEFWEKLDRDGAPGPGMDPLPAGSLLAPLKNRWVNHLKPNDWTTTRSADASAAVVLTAMQRPHLYDPIVPVDVVYTWVNDTDPEWQRRKAEAMNHAETTTRHSSAISESRYKSHDELRFSMRSLEMYASWVRNVYLVTDDQVPDWLNLSHPKLKVVSHRELFEDRGRLPTFNSHAIESQLHHIDGLSEHFLYMNDDVFFGRPVPPTLFFHSNGLSRFFPSNAKLDLGEVRADEAPVMTAAKNNRELIWREFGHTFTNKMKHVPHALQVSVLNEIEEKFPEEYRTTSESQFRAPSDYSFVSSLHHWYAYSVAKATPADIRYFYADIGHPDSPAKLDNLLRKQNVDVFCLNDHDSGGLGPVERARTLEKFLSAYYPLPSSFER